jgi:hypothetical protein
LFLASEIARELIIDRQTGKTAIAVDTIIHQTTLRQVEADYAVNSTGSTSLGAEKAGTLRLCSH